MNVAGLDLSLTATGIAVITDGGQVSVDTIRSTGHTRDTFAQRDQRIDQLSTAIVSRTVHVALAVVEGPSVMSKGGSNWDRAGLWWSVVHTLMWHGVQVAVAPPTVLKKFAAGRGNADKTAVAAGMTRLWPDVECGNDNEFDALCAATVAAQRAGMDVPTRAHHADCLTSVAWPEPTDEIRRSAA